MEHGQKSRAEAEPPVSASVTWDGQYGFGTSELRLLRRVLRWACVGVVGLGALLALLSVGAPLLVMDLFDRALTGRDLTTALGLALIAAAGLAAYFALRVLQSLLLIRIGNRLDAVLGDTVFVTMLRAEQPMGGRESKLELDAAPLAALHRLRGFLAGKTVARILDGLRLPIGVIVLCLIDFAAGGMVLLGGLVCCGVVAFGLRRSKRAEAAARQEGLSARRIAGQARTAPALTRSMGLQDGLLRRWKRDHRAELGWDGLVRDRFALTDAGLWFVIFLTALGVVALLGATAIEYRASPGAVVAGGLLALLALSGLVPAVEGVPGLWAARRDWRLVRLALVRPPAPNADTKPSLRAGRLDVDQVDLAPPGQADHILTGISFSLEDGDALGIIGPNGAGKSSLARVAAGLWPAAAGTVTLNGTALAKWPPALKAKAIGYLPQRPTLFAGTIAENIARFGHADEADVTAAATLTGAHAMIEALPHGYDTWLTGADEALSAGLCQRICLARALYKRPPVLVLDEPNTGLDPQGETMLIDLIETLKAGGTTLIVVTHRPTLVRAMSSVLVLKDGQVDKLASPRDVVPGVVPVEGRGTVQVEVAGKVS
ncbi:MAG: ATP-binding cassette domain-containing protein [Pseudomonadota bacterium]